MKKIITIIMLALSTALAAKQKGTIILVNGLPAVGKSTICPLLQEELKDTYIYLPIDKYIELLPKKLVNLNPKTVQANNPEGITIKTINDEKGLRQELVIGNKVQPHLASFPSIIKAFADQGHNIIIDGAFIGEWLAWILNALTDYNVILVGLHCPLEVAEKREKDRGRITGLARNVHTLFEAQKTNDILVNTAQHNPKECAIQIRKYIESKKKPSAADKIRKIHFQKEASNKRKEKMAQKKALLVIAHTGFQPVEYGIPKKTLEAAGYQVVTASNKIGTATTKDGSKATATITVADASAADYDAIVFIGGPGAMDNLDNEESYDLLNSAHEQDKLIGAICIAPRILAHAGILTNVEATGWDGDDKLASVFDEFDVDYAPAPVVVDQGIITAQGPQAAQEFADELVRSLRSRSK